MLTIITHRWFVVTILVLTATVAMGLAKPKDPRTPAQVPGRFHAARGLKLARVQVAQMSRHLQSLGLTPQRLVHIWEEQLRQANLGIDHSERTPRVTLSFKTLPYHRDKNIVTYGLFMSLDQWAHIERLGKNFFSPTYMNNVVGVTNRDDLVDEVVQATGFMIRKFLDHVQTDTKEW